LYFIYIKPTISSWLNQAWNWKEYIVQILSWTMATIGCMAIGYSRLLLGVHAAN